MWLQLQIVTLLGVGMPPNTDKIWQNMRFKYSVSGLCQKTLSTSKIACSVSNELLERVSESSKFYAKCL